MGMRWLPHDKPTTKYFTVNPASIVIERLVGFETVEQMLGRTRRQIILRAHLEAAVLSGDIVLRAGTPIVVADRFDYHDVEHFAFFVNPAHEDPRESILKPANWRWRRVRQGTGRRCWRFAIGTPS